MPRDSLRKKKDLIVQAMKKVCNECEREHGKKDIDECFKCPYHIIFNLLGELIS